MSIDSTQKVDILTVFAENKGYSTKEIANLTGLHINKVRQQLQKQADNKILLKLTVKNITYWALNPKNFGRNKN